MSKNVTYTANQIAVIEWLATSKFDRKPMTQALLADQLGVHEKTISRWKQLPGFTEAVIDRSRELLKSNLPEIYGALNREAEKGSFQHIKLVMEMTGEHTDRQQIETTINVEDARERLADKINSLASRIGSGEPDSKSEP